MILLVVLVTAGGLWSALQLKKETMPDINIPIVAIVTPYPGAAPGDVYDQVTDPIEKSMRGLAGIKRVSAQSGDSVSMVIAEFGYSQDMDKAESDVNKALAAVKLPENALDAEREPHQLRLGADHEARGHRRRIREPPRRCAPTCANGYFPRCRASRAWARPSSPPTRPRSSRSSSTPRRSRTRA